MYNLAIRKCTSPPLLAPRLKIFKLKFSTPPGLYPGPAEPEADMLPSEPARRAPILNLKGHIMRHKLLRMKFWNLTFNYLSLHYSVTYVYVFTLLLQNFVILMHMRQLNSGEYGGCSRISHYQRRRKSVTAAVWLRPLSWRMMGFRTTCSHRFLLSPCDYDLFAKERTTAKDPVQYKRWTYPP